MPADGLAAGALEGLAIATQESHLPADTPCPGGDSVNQLSYPAQDCIPEFAGVNFLEDAPERIVRGSTITYEPKLLEVGSPESYVLCGSVKGGELALHGQQKTDTQYVIKRVYGLAGHSEVFHVRKKMEQALDAVLAALEPASSQYHRFVDVGHGVA